jgi:group I intron endonuclease
MNFYSVYVHTTPNGKKYIGITSVSPKERWKKGKGYDTQYFSKAIKKYGWDNIKHEILFENLTKEEAEKKEVELIAFYKSNDKRYGYNIENGGRAIGRFAPETILKMSEKKKGKHRSQETKRKLSKAFKGRVFSEEWKNKISNSSKGKTLSEATRKKISLALKGRKASEKTKQKMSLARVGIKFSEETICKMKKYARNRTKEHLQKISNSLKGKHLSKETRQKLSKPIVQLDLNGNIVNRFFGIHEASRQTNIPFKQISNCCCGRRKTAHNFIWKYEYDFNNITRP